MNRATILRHDASVGHALWNDLFVSIWFLPGDVGESLDVLRDHARRNPASRVAALTIVHPAAVKPLDSSGREALNEVMRLFNGLAKARATVMTSQGFAGALLRGISAGVSLVTASSHPNRVFASTEEACAWLTRFLDPIDGRPPTASDLLAVIDAIERAPITPKRSRL